MEQSLPTSVLGRTGLEVTRLGYGTAPRKHPDDEQWGRILNGVLDSGINFIDTSWYYDRSEEFIGRFVSHRRDEYVLATKCGHWWRNDPDTLAGRTRA